MLKYVAPLIFPVHSPWERDIISSCCSSFTFCCGASHVRMDQKNPSLCLHGLAHLCGDVFCNRIRDHPPQSATKRQTKKRKRNVFKMKKSQSEIAGLIIEIILIIMGMLFAMRMIRMFQKRYAAGRFRHAVKLCEMRVWHGGYRSVEERFGHRRRTITDLDKLVQ